MQGPLPVTAPLVLNPLMARMVEAAEHDMLGVIELEKLLAVERRTVERG